MGKKHKIKLTNEKKSRAVYQPELQTYLFYGYNELEKVDSNVNFLYAYDINSVRGIFVQRYYGYISNNKFSKFSKKRNIMIFK